MPKLPSENFSEVGGLVTIGLKLLKQLLQLKMGPHEEKETYVTMIWITPMNCGLH